MAHSFPIKSGAYSSPFGDIKKALRKVADDPNDPNCKAAKAALRALGDDDDAEASDDEPTDEEVRNAVSGHGRAKALVAPEATYLSPYAAQLDEQMGLSARQGPHVSGNELILTPPRKGLL